MFNKVNLFFCFFLYVPFVLNGSVQKLLEPFNDLGSERSTVQKKVARALMANDISSFDSEETLGVSVLKDKISSLIKAKYSVEENLVIEILSEWIPIKVPKDNWSVNIFDFSANNLCSNMTIGCSISSGSEILKRVWLSLKCSVLVDGLISNKHINRSSPLSFSDFNVQSVDILNIRGGVISANMSISDLELTKAISLGQVLTWRDVTPKPKIRQGDQVDVVAMEGSMTVTMRAVALESGKIGDTIILRNENSRRNLRGEILGDGSIKVHF